jgi:hypothetical protein
VANGRLFYESCGGQKIAGEAVVLVAEVAEQAFDTRVSGA